MLFCESDFNIELYFAAKIEIAFKMELSMGLYRLFPEEVISYTIRSFYQVPI